MKEETGQFQHEETGVDFMCLQVYAPSNNDIYGDHEKAVFTVHTNAMVSHINHQKEKIERLH